MIAHGNQTIGSLLSLSRKSDFMNLDAADSRSILQRVAAGERQAASECLDLYNNLVWNLAKKYTDSTDETERMVRVIFLDIWKNAKAFDTDRFDEESFITIVALKRLLGNK